MAEVIPNAVNFFCYYHHAKNILIITVVIVIIVAVVIVIVPLVEAVSYTEKWNTEGGEMNQGDNGMFHQ